MLKGLTFLRNKLIVKELQKLREVFMKIRGFLSRKKIISSGL